MKTETPEGQNKETMTARMPIAPKIGEVVEFSSKNPPAEVFRGNWLVESVTPTDDNKFDVTLVRYFVNSERAPYFKK